MAVDFGIRVEIDSTVSADKKAELVRRVIQVLEDQTLSIVYAASYLDGTGTDQLTINVT